ncbi:MAG: YbfB/YjiJ family MFS transporter [Hyphomicrobiaceae bacterium]
MTRANWQRVAIGAGAAMFLGMALGRFSYSAMIPALIEAGEVDAIAAGYIGGANLVGFLSGAAASTWAARAVRLDHLLPVVIVAAVIALIASALPWGPLWLGAWRGVIGVSTGFIMVLGLAMTAQAAPPEHRASAMSYIFIGVGSGILFGATVVPACLRISILTAWLAVALAGVCAGAIAILCWRGVHHVAAATKTEAQVRPMQHRAAWSAVIAASFLFSFGLVPHTIYWFDYLARDLGLGYTIAGWHWTGVGVFAILGPIAAAWLARQAGTAAAIVVTYILLAIGLGVPWLAQSTPALIASTIIFGAQPAASTLLGARARDLGSAGNMPAMMRATILANGVGSALAGITIPKLLDVTGSYEMLFLTGGVAMLLGGLLCLATSFQNQSSEG